LKFFRERLKLTKSVKIFTYKVVTAAPSVKLTGISSCGVAIIVMDVDSVGRR
jgi:hypothetical protein